MREWFVKVRWGANSLVALYVSVISGVVLAFQYEPSEPLYSTGNLELVVPFGVFWRSLHFFSSQMFFLLLAVHVVAILVDRKGRKQVAEDQGGRDGREKWLKLTLSVPVAVLLLFTGYILRGDATGESAGIIAENIILSVPFLGSWINLVLFNITNGGLKVVYANHLIGLGILWGYLVWNHLRRYSISWRDHGVTLTAALAISLFFKAPLEPYIPGSFHISGPWFFVGLQELLRYIQPFWAGIVFPTLGLAILHLVIRDEDGDEGVVLKCGFAWLAVYMVATVIGLLR